jgi:hypothetical protein
VAASMPTTETVIEEAAGEHNIGLARLLETKLPPENYRASSWRRGGTAAHVGEAFGFDVRGARGADKFLKSPVLLTSAYFGGRYEHRDRPRQHGQGLRSTNGAEGLRPACRRPNPDNSPPAPKDALLARGRA